MPEISYLAICPNQNDGELKKTQLEYKSFTEYAILDG